MASGPPFPDPVSCENLYGILISNYYCSHWQAAIFLCVFVCIGVISKDNDNVKMEKNSHDNDKIIIHVHCKILDSFEKLKIFSVCYEKYQDTGKQN